MKFNKTLAAALLLGVTLTGCDSMTGNKNATTDDKKAPVAEDKATTDNKATTDDKAKTDDKAMTDDKTKMDDKTTTDTKSKDDKSMKDDKTSTGTKENSTENMTDETTTDISTNTDTSSMSKEEKIQALEKAIFDNRSMARAGELLLELTPEKVADIQDELESAIDESNTLLEKAQQELDTLKAE